MKKREKKRNGIPALTRKRILAMLLVFFFCYHLILPAEADEQERQQLVSQLYARSAALVDADSGRVLLGKEEHVMRPMASTTKILTCILALERGNPEDLVTASANAAGQPKVHLGMREGEQFYLRDLLYSLMLESHNDSAVAIAEHLAGSVPEFAGWMNEKAEEIGCTEAHFVTPNGLDEEDAGGVHRISAADLAKIMGYCVLHSPKSAEFLAITQTSSYSFSDAEGKGNFCCNNHNAFLQMMDGAISGKTGFTGDAGYCYVGALQREGRTFVVALLACGWPNNKNYKWSDTRKMMEYGITHYQYEEVWEMPKLSRIPVEDGISEDGLFGEAETEVAVEESGTRKAVLAGADDVAEERVNVPERLTAPVEKGMPVGKVTYFLNGEAYGSDRIVIKDTIRQLTFAWIATKMCEMFYQFKF